MSSIIYNGHEIQDLIINGNQAQLWLNGQKLYPSDEPGPVDPYNPLGLPPFTIRVKFKSDYTPTMGDSQTLVDAGENVWDITKNNTDWSNLLGGLSALLEVLGANSSGVTNMGDMFSECTSLSTVPMFNTSSCTTMSSMFAECTSLSTVPLFDTSSCTNMGAMFKGCTNLSSVPLFDTSSCTMMSAMFYSCGNLTSVPLFNTSSCTNMSSMLSVCESITSVPLFDTSSCTNMSSMFIGCTSLTSVPLFDTSSCRNMSYMFNNCVNVQSGALALYQQASTQADPPTEYSDCFTDCGSNTVTGAAELAQIPSSWGGTGA